MYLSTHRDPLSILKSVKEVSACIIWLGCTLGHQNVCHKFFSAIFDLLLDVIFFDLHLIYIIECREGTCYHAISFRIIYRDIPRN